MLPSQVRLQLPSTASCQSCSQCLGIQYSFIFCLRLHIFLKIYYILKSGSEQRTRTRFSPRQSPTVRNYHYCYNQDMSLRKFSRTSAVHSFGPSFLPFSVSLPSLIILLEVSAAAFLLVAKRKKKKLWTKKPSIFLQVVSILLMSNNGRILFSLQSGRTVSFSSVELFLYSTNLQIICLTSLVKPEE